MNKLTRRGLFGLGAAGTAYLAHAAYQGWTLQDDADATETQVAQARGSINLYSARHYDTDKTLYSGFTQATGIRVNVIEAEADALIERIRNEGRNSPADVLMTVDAGRLWRAQQAGMFQPVNSAVLNKAVPANLRDPQGNWFGLSRRARVLIYNKAKVKPAQLSTYEDLATPKWRKQVLTRSSSNVYSQSLTGALIAIHGAKKTEDWAKGIATNLARPPQGGDTDQIRACAAGVGSVAIANHYYLMRLMASNKPEDKAVVEKVALFFPNQRTQGTHVNICGAGVVRNAPNRAAAIRFLEYLVSPQAQAQFARGNFELPVVRGVQLDPLVARLGNFKAETVSAAVFGRNNPEALKIMDRAGWR